MAEKPPGNTLTPTALINRLAHIPELLESHNEIDEAENIQCLIEDLKNEL